MALGRNSSERGIIVVGGSGFIGTRLVRNLVASRYRVSIADRRLSEDFPHLCSIVDVRDYPRLCDACEGAAAIVNLAAEHRDDVRPLQLYREVNVGGAENTCRAAESLGISRIVFTSSVAIYGFPRGEVDEAASAQPFNEYGKTKLQAEAVYQRWVTAAPGRSLTIVRPTVVFGEGNRGNVYNLLRQIARGRFAMIGSGRNRKSMAYVENIAAFLQFALRFGPGTHVYNYVDKPDWDMNTLAARVLFHLGRPESRMKHFPVVAGYGLGLVADVAAFALRRKFAVSTIRVRKFLANTVFACDRVASAGFIAPFSLDEGMRRTIEVEFQPRRERHVQAA